MPIVTSTALIRFASIFHISLAFYFLTAPHKIVSQTLVFLLGQSMRLPPPKSLSTPTPASALIALLFALLGVSDLGAFTLPDGRENAGAVSNDVIPISVANVHWSTQSLIRSFFFFGVTGYAYLFRDGARSVDVSDAGAMDAGAHLKNSLVFTLGFLETVIWYWTFLTLRQERQRKVEREEEKKRTEENML